ncbi:tripartite tricarboxylate transporter substrate binding protein [Ramlibacter sp. G-1-2-2]|uniref:Tripartite tricarboxylate transporter substrate binding protein n=1 Tax=Ramlibacter agri TaxID=2728837 RepID=A0A848H7H8_9BURK|nr:tripartite tricarboxylate transporter substrate-binding protein [Ramlibacter agri]NML46745.1 tripartite tricarboxylate transporter substrate binding protein [Ramlibacter agri]
MTRIAATLAAFAFAAVSHQALAAWPDKPIRLVIPFPPGGGTDVVGRLIGQKMSEELGVTVVIDNRPGADTQIGTALVAKAAPDGYTIGMVTPSLAINKTLYAATAQYDPIKDFAPVSLVAATPFYLAVATQAPYKTASDLVDASRKPGANFTYGTASSIGYLSGEQTRAALKLDARHIPYKGSAASVTAVAAGELTYTIDTILAMRPLVDAGKLRILGTSAPQRVNAFPEIPALGETWKGFSIVSWWGIVAPAGTPAAAVSRMDKALAKILTTAEMRQKLEALGAVANYADSEKFSAVIRHDLDSYGDTIKSVGLEPGH